MTTLAVGARSTLVAAEVSKGCGEKINEFETPIPVACSCYIYFSASRIVFLFLPCGDSLPLFQLCHVVFTDEAGALS